ncbi:MAG TPA: hypothetical protein VD994_18355 [Prosthecobacter sp.]|nr:hypothetical protein [Prosthecobacter sp.]
MRPICFLVLLSFWFGGCADIPRGFHAVWTLPLPPGKDTPAPAGFTITPTQAIAIAHDSGALSRKHILHVYADADHYYIHDVFFGGGAHRALKQAVRIHGRTGAIVRNR